MDDGMILRFRNPNRQMKKLINTFFPRPVDFSIFFSFCFQKKERKIHINAPQLYYTVYPPFPLLFLSPPSHVKRQFTARCASAPVSPSHCLGRFLLSSAPP